MARQSAVTDAYPGLGDFDRAFARLDEAYKQGAPTLIRLRSDARSAQFRSALRRPRPAAEAAMAVSRGFAHRRR
jgi:hypothetical protein